MALANYHSSKHMKRRILCITNLNFIFIPISLSYSYNINTSGGLTIEKIIMQKNIKLYEDAPSLYDNLMLLKKESLEVCKPRVL
jgi:hypothetical protein